jgi:hypothetical protein
MGPRPRSRLSPAAGSTIRWGVASDTRGNIWVSNSGVLNLPCPGNTISFKSIGGSVTLIGADGSVKSPRKGFRGGGAKVPWGMAIDGNDNVWVSNFDGRRVSEFCGVRAKRCPRGKRTGAPISPKDGYGFAGLQRSTAVEIDPSGDVCGPRQQLMDHSLMESLLSSMKGRAMSRGGSRSVSFWRRLMLVTVGFLGR